METMETRFSKRTHGRMKAKEAVEEVNEDQTQDVEEVPIQRKIKKPVKYSPKKLSK